MPENEQDEEPTQDTPKGKTIPVPKREDVFRDLERVAKPRKQNGGPPPKT